MPVRKVKGGYRWGSRGKIYPTREQAEWQGRAAYAAGYREPVSAPGSPVSGGSRRGRGHARKGR